MSFAARNARTSLMSTNQGKRKRGTSRITAKKCLRHFGDCGILNIKKDICANRCPTGVTDRQLARLNDYDKNSRLTLAEQGGYFCVLLLSLPIEYSIPKQVKPKLNTAIIRQEVQFNFSLYDILTTKKKRASRSRLYGENPFLTVNNKLFFNSCQSPILIFSEYRHWHF